MEAHWFYQAFNFVLIALAGFRISRALTREDGPGYIFSDIRVALGKKAANSESKFSAIWGYLAELAICPYCNQIYILIVLTGLSFISMWFVYIFALWGLATLFQILEDINT